MIPDAGIAFAVSFLFSLVALPYWIRRSREHKLLISDAQKVPPRSVPYLAGVIVVFAAVIGILFYVAVQTYAFKNGDNTDVLLAGVVTILICAKILYCL